ncbi:carotenoid oxygenase family protein [Streptomyces yerevanensis]|uniref:carotenoid oxygenase family protein n=1 Tax=Streptomyces yerevanensis TaxID=66378 RepID=UPI000690BAAD|nr:carotenoid oxygenase family protein [Streptomyces yerevanensis]
MEEKSNDSGRPITNLWGEGEEPQNRFLDGPFAPVAQEVTAHQLEVIGKIPEELNGRYVWCGPNASPFDPEDPRTYNWFTGSGMLSGVRLRESRAEWYRNRFVRDELTTPHLGVPRLPGPEPLSRREPYRDMTGPRFVEANVVNTHVWAVGGRTYAFSEAGALPVEVSYELESVARCDFGGTLNGSWTGHPHRDPDSGELHGFSYFWQWDHVSYQVLGTDGKINKTVDIPVEGRPQVHDMAITAKYAIFLDGALEFNERIHREGHDFPWVWDLGKSVRWGLVPRDGGTADVKWCALDQQTHVFHILNAFDLPDSKVAVDACSSPKVFVDDLSGPTESRSRLDRYILDPVTGTSKIETMSDIGLEMPRLDDRMTGKQHRYGYFNRLEGAGAIAKLDVQKQSTEFYEYGDGKAGVESVFVPRTADSAEDDGWVLGYAIDVPTQTTEVLILPAEDLASGPVARIKVPHRPQFGFHSNWIADEELEQANA